MFNTKQRTEKDPEKRPFDHKYADFHANHFSEQYATFSTSYIEFDEQGDFWERDQFTRAVEDIRRCRKPVILVVYAHGWENHSQSDDVWRFNEMLLRKIADADDIKQHYDVRGVYLGWNGKRLHTHAPGPVRKVIDLSQPFTFYGRKNAASQRVADTAVTETIFSLSMAAREQNRKSRVILIGHSFGALVMERAVAQGLVGALMFQEGKPNGNRTVVMPADLILLLNSAAESIYAKLMIDFFHAHPQKQGGVEFIGPNRPLIVSVTSRADWATGWLFGVGTGISNSVGAFRDYQVKDKPINQRHFLTHTAGHSDVLLSHDIVPVEPTNGPPHIDPDRVFAENLARPKGNGIFATESTSLNGKEQQWWRIKSLDNENNETPYWVVRAPEEICKSHTDVWNENMVDLMAAIFRIAQPQIGSPARKMTVQTVPQPASTPEPNAPPPVTTVPEQLRVVPISKEPQGASQSIPPPTRQTNAEKKRQSEQRGNR